MKVTVNIKNLDTERARKLCKLVEEVLAINPKVNTVHLRKVDFDLMRRSVSYRVRKRLKENADRFSFAGFQYASDKKQINLTPVADQ